MAAALPPASEPTKRKFLRPRAMPRIPRSATLLSNSRKPSATGSHALHSAPGRSGSRRRGATCRTAGQLLGEPGVEIIEHRDGRGLAELCPALGRGAARLFSTATAGRCAGWPPRPSARPAIDGHRRAAPDMGHAGDFADGAGAVEVLEAGVAVGMHRAAEAGEMVLGMLPLPVAREAIPCRRRRAPAPGALVAGIGPEPGGLGLPVPGASMLTGVSSAKIASAESTCRPMASASGSSSAVDFPTQSASVERSRSSPSRSKIWDWR